MPKARKERPLTDGQVQCLLAAEPTLYGDIRIAHGPYGRSVAALSRRGLIEGERPHAYLTAAGRQKLAELTVPQCCE